MLTITIVLFVVALLAEGSAVILLVREARVAATTLRAWRDANPENHAKGSYGQTSLLNEVVPGLLGAPRARMLAVTLVATGLAAGSAGNFTSLAL